MKNQYVGDVNDFAKYALLRVLGQRLRLLVCWMLTPDDGSSDGRHLSYLCRPEHYERYDPDLFRKLGGLIARGERSVMSIERERLVPGARFYSHILRDDLVERRRYFEGLGRPARGSDVVFFDPDNGLEIASVPIGRRNSAKYLYRHELAEAYERNLSAVVYQHFPRVDRDRFILNVAASTRDACPNATLLTARTGGVAYLCFVQPRHRVLFADAWADAAMRFEGL